jgi:molybdenum cofactor cytidylyltransferase
MASRPVLVVLAAGRGSRFVGSEHHKLEQTFGDTTVLGQSLRHAVATHLPLVVVTTAALAPLAHEHVAARDVLVLDDGHAVGMGHSIAAGVAARPHASGWLILPGDMPLVQPATLLAVAAALAQHHAVAYAQYRGRRGHPVAFGTELFSELIALDGDDGARRLVARYPGHAVEIDDAGVLIDIDTQQDLQGAMARMGAPSRQRDQHRSPESPGAGGLGSQVSGARR